MDIIELLASDPAAAIKEIEDSNEKKVSEIIAYRKEYKHGREIRPTQVGTQQVKKTITVGGLSKDVEPIRLPINFAKKIVTTSAAFEVGKPVTLTASVSNKLSVLLLNIWKFNRLDAALQQMILQKKKETQAAIQFYIKDVKPGSTISKANENSKLPKQAKEIRSVVLQNEKGKMIPYFDESGNMTAFMWEYDVTINDAAQTNYQIWDEIKMYHYVKEGDKITPKEGFPAAHGFDRIPIVYTAQDEPEWFEVREMIDRIENLLSKLGDSNDYSAYPLLQVFGEIQSMPDKSDAGKVLRFPLKKDDDGKWVHGEAKFLESSGAAKSQELELKKLEEYIFSISQTPNLSFESLKSIGPLSGVAIQLMFMDAMIKATMNEGENRTMIERMINIIISGTVETTSKTLKNESLALYFDIEFNSILPGDIKEAIESVTSAVAAGVMSRKTAVEYIDMNSDVEQELNLISEDEQAKAKNNAAAGSGKEKGAGEKTD